MYDSTGLFFDWNYGGLFAFCAGEMTMFCVDGREGHFGPGSLHSRNYSACISASCASNT